MSSNAAVSHPSPLPSPPPLSTINRSAPPCIPSDRPLALLFDYDGTLSPIVSDPAQARLSAEHITLLRHVVQLPQVCIAVVSGRSVSQLQLFLAEVAPGEGLWLAGLHGGEIYHTRQQSFVRQPDPALLSHLRLLHETVVTAFAGVGLLDQLALEDKLYSLALHVRNTPEPQASEALTLFRQIVEQSADFSQVFRLQPGKLVLEAVPASFHKGDAVRFLLDRWGDPAAAEPKLPIYLGDDLTDESGFEAVNERGGWSIRVGTDTVETGAQFCLQDVAGVYQWLAQLMVAD